MKLKQVFLFAGIFAVISAACNLPFAVRGNVVPTFLPTNPPILASSTGTRTVTQTPTLTSPIVLIPSATATITPLPTSNPGTITPTLSATVAIPIAGSSTQTTPVPVTFAPTADPLKIFVGSCGANQTTITVVINRPDIVGSMLLLDRLDQLPDGSASSFGTAATMKAIDVGKYQATITAPTVKPGKNDFKTVLDYKFAVLDTTGKLVASSFVYNNIAVTVCKK